MLQRRNIPPLAGKTSLLSRAGDTVPQPTYVENHYKMISNYSSVLYNINRMIGIDIVIEVTAISQTVTVSLSAILEQYYLNPRYKVLYYIKVILSEYVYCTQYT